MINLDVCEFGCRVCLPFEILFPFFAFAPSQHGDDESEEFVRVKGKFWEILEEQQVLRVVERRRSLAACFWKSEEFAGENGDFDRQRVRF